LSLARTSCRLLFTVRPTARSLAALRDVVRSRNPSKSTLAHDAVAIAVLHKHHPIIRVGAGLIQFVYRSHLRLAKEATRNRNAFSPFFPRVFQHQARISPHIFLHFFALCTSESLLRLPISNMTILPAKQAACDLCGLHGSAMPRLPLENWSAIVLSKTWRCGGDAHVQIYTSICVYLCLLLYYYI